ncbi:ParA family protein [Mesorhizobium sp. B2-5-4]|uniref:ParA family protein n=1 Tax=Mesorhizobium sp. B2-5-4 TaxID=2589926 RepID=UPI00112D6618|nr:ParA family protein [Mesorhizobium sp. B2-5-4]TPK39223.1 ParA family protein [Mesorhizobium sp. B2-5-4]
MAVVGFVSEKGGVGKTTACYHIAVGLHRFHKKSVLVIDADYQRGGITGRLFPDLIEQFRQGTLPDVTLFAKFQQLYSASTFDPSVTIRTASVGVDAIVADTRLANVTTDKLPSTNNIVENNLSLLRHLKVIREVINHLGQSYDYVLIDSHPEISDVLRSIIYASDYCVSPVKLDLQSSVGVPTVVAEIGTVNNDVALMKATIDKSLVYNPTVFAGAMGMMAREYGGAPKQTEADEIRRLRRAGTVFTEYVTEGDGIRRAAQERLPVYDIGGANAAKQSAQFRSLTSEFLTKCP